MVSMPKEYIKEYQRQKRSGIKKPNMEKFKKNKNCQVQTKTKIEKIKAPKISETKDSKPITIEDINYNKWCNSTETKRFYYFTVMGKTSRQNEQTMWDQLKTKQEIINITTSIDSKLLREIKENPLFLKQKLKMLTNNI